MRPSTRGFAAAQDEEERVWHLLGDAKKKCLILSIRPEQAQGGQSKDAPSPVQRAVTPRR
jgi:hypothetical protein